MSAGRILFAAGVLSAVLFSAAPANAVAPRADVVSNAVTALESGNLYVGDPTARISDPGSVRAALGAHTKIAVLPLGSGDAFTIADEIGTDLTHQGITAITVGVVVGNQFDAASSRYCSGYASNEAGVAVDRNQDALAAGGTHPDLTDLLVTFGTLVSSGQLAGTCGGGAGGATGAGSFDHHSTSHFGETLAILVVVFLLGIGAFVIAARRRNRRELALARANVESYYDRLAGEVNTLDPGQNDHARQALADAAERYTAAGSQLAHAETVHGYALARRATLEGLYAARTAREALGMDPGQRLPPIIGNPAAEHLSQPAQVTAGGQQYQGYPTYTPGAPYYYGGGMGVPGGWYGIPFWETLLLGGALGGAFGRGGFGGGFGGGWYDGGDLGGRSSGGGDFGNSGGGDFGSSGGGGGGDSGGGSW